MRIRLLFLCILFVGSFFSSGCENTSDSLSDTDGDHDTDTHGEMTEQTESDLSEADTEDASNWMDLVIPEFEAFSPVLCHLPASENLLGFDPAYRLVKDTNPVEYKNFYLLTLLHAVQEIKTILAENSTLNSVAENKRGTLHTANSACETKTCFYDAVRLSESDLQQVMSALADTLIHDSVFIDEVKAHIKPSGAFILYAESSDTDLLETILEEQFATLDATLEKYGNKLEMATFKELFSTLETEMLADSLFYWPYLQATIQMMLATQRDEAGRYEPMRQGENKAAFDQLNQINWNAYPFTVILVPGLGPTSPDVALNPGGAERCDMAALRFQAGLAPLIVVSGGHVHPDQTPYSEAIEMKKYLMNTYHIEESHILVDPHARHTTTNLRNLARLLYRYSIPADRPYMTTTDIFQSAYIRNLEGRCLEELMYVPYRHIEKMTDTDNCVMPSVHSLYIDPRDPLDP